MSDEPLQEVLQRERTIVLRHARGLRMAFIRIGRVLEAGTEALQGVTTREAFIYRASLLETEKQLKPPLAALEKHLDRIEAVLARLDAQT